MKTYIVYINGVELPRSQWIKAGSHNAAEKKAQDKAKRGDYGPPAEGTYVSVAYTEV